MRPSFLFGALSVVLFLLGSTGAHHCTTWSTSQPEVQINQFYIDSDPCQVELECVFSVWFYEEANGIEGLQRGDEVVDDTCHGMIESDVIPCMLLPVALMTPRRDRKDRRAGSAALAATALVGGLAIVPTAEAC